MKKLHAIISAVAAPTIALAVIIAASALSCSPASSLSKGAMEADSVKSVQIAEMLENRLYKVDFDLAIPLSAPSFPLNYPYYVSVIGGHVESFLPYFGRAWNIPYDGGEGLRFRAAIGDYKAGVGRKGRHRIVFDARTAEDGYTFDLEVYPSGQAYLTVYSSRRQSISFSGRIDLDPEFEEVKTER